MCPLLELAFQFMGKCWEKGESRACSLLCHWLSALVPIVRFPNSVTPVVFLQSQLFFGVPTCAIAAALMMFSSLLLGDGFSPALSILSSVYRRVPETRLWNLVSQSSASSSQLCPSGQRCPQLDTPGVQPILLRSYGHVLADAPRCTSQSQIHCRDMASASKRARKGSGEHESRKGKWGGQHEKWGGNQAAPSNSTFAVPLWEIQSS